MTSSQHPGLALGHMMAGVAASNAGSTWTDMAYDAFKDYARTHDVFTTEAVRQANPNLPPPPDKRAWGQIALRAKRNGVVVGHGWVRADSPSVHGMVVTAWMSKMKYSTGAADET